MGERQELIDVEDVKREILTKAWKKRRFILNLVLVAILVVVIMVVSFVMKSYKNQIAELSEIVERYENEAAVYEEASKEVSLAVLESTIQDVGKLVTAEYLYTNVGQYEDVKKIFDVDIALTKKSFIVKWNGVITAGIDLSKASITESNNVITVSLPKAQIIAHDPDNSSFETIDEKSGLFNPIKTEDVRKFDLESETAMIERAKAGLLLQKAEENAQMMITRMIQTNPAIKDEYIVEVEFTEK